jgi:hypothetical protein
MEPNKIEEQFKELLNSRELQPSDKAWDRLDAMLSVAEEKKTKRSFGWLYIAASIIGFIFVGTLFFSQTEELIDVRRNDVVLQEKEEKSSEHIIQGQSGKDILPSIQSQGVAEVSNDNQKSKNQITKSEGIVHCNTCPSEKVIITRELRSNWRSNQKTNRNLNQINNEKIAEFKNETSIAHSEIPKTVESNKSLTDKESILKSDNNLLVSLDNTAKQLANKKATIKVDAKSLLSQVDGEVENTFREKVFTKINKNYQEIKVALVNRNKE